MGALLRIPRTVPEAPSLLAYSLYCSYSGLPRTFALRVHPLPSHHLGTALL